MSFAFYDNGKPYSTERNLNIGATFINIAKIIPLSHYNVVNIAWAKAAYLENALDHQEEGKGGDDHRLVV